MITWETYDNLKMILHKLNQLLLANEDYLPNWKDYSFFIEYQKEIRSFGELLENSMELGRAKVVVALEEHCEHISRWINASADDKVKLWQNILKDFEIILCELARCCNKDVLSCCTIVRNEGEYIEEWLEYHLMVGVTKFFIYDNESTDGLYDILVPYIEKGIVVYQEWKGDKCQLSAYNDAIARYKNQVGYIAFIDADEFIVPTEHVMLPELILKIFAQNPEGEALGVNWRVYGSSGHINKPKGLVIENYVYRDSDISEKNRHVKSIANSRWAEGFQGSSHCCMLHSNKRRISEYGTPLFGPFFTEGRCDKIRINHYYTKSKEEFVAKLNRGWPDQPHDKFLPEQIEYKFLKADMKSNEIEDRIMYRYLEDLKKKVK